MTFVLFPPLFLTRSGSTQFLVKLNLCSIFVNICCLPKQITKSKQIICITVNQHM